MKKTKVGIAVAGSLIADVFYEIETYPKQGFLTNVRATSLNIGGTANMMIDFAKMDEKIPIKACAIVGDDDKGRQMLSILSQYPSIDTDNITVEGNSSVTMVMNAQDTKQRTFFYCPEASDSFDESYINWDNINTKIFHLEYLLLMKRIDSYDAVYGTHGARILHDAQERGMLTSIDVVSEQGNRAKEVVSAALKYTDICCINESEAEAITGVTLLENGEFNLDKVKEAISVLKGKGVSKWVVIHAPRVGFGYDCEKQQFFKVPSLQLPDGYIKGSNGAGDAYCSGILYGAYYDWELGQAMKYARSCAACSLSENNGTDGMRSYIDILLCEKELMLLENGD